MFKRVAGIRDFGVFCNFSGATLPEFGSFNLIYGWNYSGKTTLSRVFRCLEINFRHQDYPDATFSITHADGINRDHEFGTPTIVRVFNEDFRKQHLLWDDTDGFNPILLLGSENIEKQNALTAKRAEMAKVVTDRSAADEEATRLTDAVNNAESECATQIVKELAVGRFDRRHVRQIMEGWNGVLPNPLSDEGFQTERAKLAAEQKEDLPDLHVDTESVDELWKAASDLLGEQIGAATTISRLADNPEVGVWVEAGLRLHQQATYCEFCEGHIKPARVAELNAHFSEAFTNLKTRIAKAADRLTQRMVNVSGGAFAKSQFYLDLHAEHAEAGSAFGRARDRFNAALQDLIERLRKKESNPFEIVAQPDITPPVADLADSVGRFQRLIDENNRRTREFKAERDTAIDRLKNHYVAAAMGKVDLYRLQKEIADFRLAERTAAARIGALESEVTVLQAELSESTKGAEAINDVLRRFFGKEDIQVKVTEGDKFALVRANAPARNLSEGERTAIAFCYFVTKLLENGNQLADTIVYIDDPISSLDAHHLLHVNAFLKNTFLKHDETATPKYTCLAKQVFISTHNYEFFHLTWDWMNKRKGQGFALAYLVERVDGGGVISSRIVECPKSILQFRSEYLFLYHQLAAYAASPTNDAMVIFNLGNMARRFVEGYLAFKFFEFSAIDQKLPLVITDAVMCERARKFMHFYSHTLSRGGGMKLPDMAEAHAAVTSILDGVKDHDPIHFAAMQATA